MVSQEQKKVRKGKEKVQWRESLGRRKKQERTACEARGEELRI